MRIADPRSPLFSSLTLPGDNVGGDIVPEEAPAVVETPSEPVSKDSGINAEKLAKSLKKARRHLRKVEKRLDGIHEATSYVITKSLEEDRYTFGPFYTPQEVDAHGEYAQATELQKAMWNFVRKGNRNVHKQHDTSKPIGEVVESTIWPYPAEVELRLPGREVRKAILPAGTAYLGVIWSPEAWPAVKGGAITGYSLGGRAMRVQTGEILPPSRR